VRSVRSGYGPSSAKTAGRGTGGEAKAVTSMVIAERRVAGVTLFGIRLSGVFCVLSVGLSVDVSGAVLSLDLRPGGAEASLFCALPVVAGSASSAQGTGDTLRADAVGAAVR
jgi:hypothetical protein